MTAEHAMRRRVLLAGWVAVLGTFGTFYWLNHIARASNDVRSVIMAAVMALTFVIAWSTFALAIVITRTAKRILRAVDLASTKEAR